VLLSIDITIIIDGHKYLKSKLDSFYMVLRTNRNDKCRVHWFHDGICVSFADLRQVQGDGPRLGPGELLREPPDVVKGDRFAAALLAVVRPTGRVHHGADRARAQRGPDRGAGDLGAVRARARVEGDPGG